MSLRAGAMVVGHWSFVGSVGAGAKGNEFPEFLTVGKLGHYRAIRISGAGSKELVHRQLYQELVGRRF